MSKRFRSTSVALLALLIALSMGAAGCTKQQSTGTDKAGGTEKAKGGTLVYKISEPAFIDAYNLQESEGTQVGQAIFDSLTAIDPKTNKVIPAAAASWEPNADATVWTFKLQPGAKFHDGTEVKAADFVYGWNRIATSPIAMPKAPSEIAYHLSAVKGFDASQEKGVPLEGIKAVDDSTFEVTLTYSFADFPFVTAHPGLAPVPQAAVEKDPAAYAEMPVGNGPFKMSEPWKHDQYVKTVAFADYYGDKPLLDGVEFKIYKDDQTSYRDFQAGNVDFTDIPDGQIKASIEQYGESKDGYTVQPKEQVLLGAEAAIYYYTFNNDDPVFKNIKVRQALSMAINRQAIAETVYEGTRKPADNFVPPGLQGFEAGTWGEFTKYDVEAAKKLLAEAGYPEGKGMPPVKININTGAGHEKPAELIQSDWKALGVNATIEGLEFPQHIDKMQGHKYQVGRAGWIADYPIMDNFLYPEFTSKSADNWAGYKNADVDAKLAKARATTNDAERIKAYQEVNKTVAAGFPVAPVVWYAHRHVGSERTHDLVYSNQGLASFETAWLTNGGKASE